MKQDISTTVRLNDGHCPKCGAFHDEAGLELIPGQAEIAVPFFKTPEEEQQFRDWWQENVTKRLLEMAHVRADTNKLRAERDAKQLVLNERGLELDDWKRHHLALAQECDTLRQQLTNAIDERNIARKESTALAELHTEHERVVADLHLVGGIGQQAIEDREALRQRVAELEQALGWYAANWQGAFGDRARKALAASAPDAQRGATP